MNKKSKLEEFFDWIDEVSENSKHKVGVDNKAYKHLKIHITNPTNMKRIKKNIEYIIDDPQNIKGQAPNDWHKLSYIKKGNNIIYTMDINEKDRMAYYIEDDVIIFSMFEHIE